MSGPSTIPISPTPASPSGPTCTVEVPEWARVSVRDILAHSHSASIQQILPESLPVFLFLDSPKLFSPSNDPWNHQLRARRCVLASQPPGVLFWCAARTDRHCSSLLRGWKNARHSLSGIFSISPHTHVHTSTTSAAATPLIFTTTVPSFMIFNLVLCNCFGEQNI